MSIAQEAPYSPYSTDSPYSPNTRPADRGRERKHQIPNRKFQTNSNDQNPNDQNKPLGIIQIGVKVDVMVASPEGVLNLPEGHLLCL